MGRNRKSSYVSLMSQETPPPQPPKKREPILDPRAFEASPIIALVLVMIAIHVWIVASGQGEANPLYGKMAFVPNRLLSGEEPLRLLSYAFLHINWVHVTLNTLMIYLLGSRCWRVMGTARFFAFFGVTAIAGALAFALVRPHEISQLAGASAVVYGLLASFQRYRFRVMTLRGKDVRLAAIGFVAFIIVFEVAAGATSVNVISGGVGRAAAWEAHIGGFLAGWFVTPWLVNFWPQ